VLVRSMQAEVEPERREEMIERSALVDRRLGG
jgi:hypothetical protein